MSNLDTFTDAIDCASIIERSSPTLSELRQKSAFKEPLDIYTVANLLWSEPYDDSLELGITFTEHNLNTYTMSYLKKTMCKLFRDYDKYFIITCFMDWSESDRPHIHGVIKPFGNGIKKVDAFKRKLFKIFGKTEVKPIHGRKAYIAYMLKIYLKVDLTRNDIISNDWRVNTTALKQHNEYQEPMMTPHELDVLILKHLKMTYGDFIKNAPKKV